MYLEHFGLREAPFRITPHTEFFFAGASRGSTLEALIYAITHDEGIVKVSGEVGSGKTMLCRMLLEKLPDHVETVYLANPSLSRDEILHAIAEELHISLPEGKSHLHLRTLQERLLSIYAAGRLVVVMIDEAHAMPPETLEEIRLLSNLESNRHKLMHIVLFGQSELDVHLSDVSMRQLKERITHNFALEPLRRTDIGSYLMFRMRAAGYRGPDLFTARAVQMISHASEGLTRRVNILADKALLCAFSENRHQIDSRQVKTAIRDAQFNPMHGGSKRPVAWLAAAAVIVLIAGLSYLAGSQNLAQEAGTETPATEVLPENSAPRAAQSGLTTPLATSERQVMAPATTLEARLAATSEWLRITPDTHFVIQMLSTDASAQQEVESFLESAVRKLDPTQIRVYRSSLSGRDRYGVIYGDYPSAEAASAELTRVAAVSAGSKPYVRPVRKLR